MFHIVDVLQTWFVNTVKYRPDQYLKHFHNKYDNSFDALSFRKRFDLYLWPGDGGGRPSSVMSLGVTSVGGHSHGHPASPIGVGSSWEDIDPQIPRALGCQRRLALADLGCTVDHLGPTPANLIPPSSFAVSCDLKALWPGVLGCWGMGGRCTTWPINPPEVYTSFGPDPPGRQAAGCPCQSIGWGLCSQSLCADVGWSVCWHCLP